MGQLSKAGRERDSIATPSQTPNVIPCHIVPLHLDPGNTPAWPRTETIHPNEKPEVARTHRSISKNPFWPGIPASLHRMLFAKQDHSFFIPALGPSLSLSLFLSLCDIDGHQKSWNSAPSVGDCGTLSTLISSLVHVGPDIESS